MIKDQFKLYQNAIWIQLIYNLLFIGFWYFSNNGLAFWDDFTYLHFANQINTGVFEITNNHFTSRIALIYPVAELIKWLGINAYTVSLYPLISTLLLLNLFFALGRKTNIWIGVIGGFILICDYHTLIFSTHLFPEMPMALYVFVALFFYDMVNRREGDHRFLALLTSLALLVAFWTKTTVFLIGPLFMFLFWNDWFRRKKHRSYWLITLLCLLFFLLLDGLYYYEIKGDFFFRFQNISNNHEPTVKTFYDKPLVDLIKRLTFLPLIGFTRGGYFIPLLFALPALFSLKKPSWLLDQPEKLWPISVVILVASWWFMSTNWKFYSPMPLDTRHITFIIPLMLVAGVNWWTKQDFIQKWINLNYFWLVFLPFLLIPSYTMSQAKQKNFSQLEDLFEEKILVDQRKALIFTDGLISYGHPYFSQFNETDWSFEWFSETQKRINKGDALLINPAYLNERYQDEFHLDQILSAAAKVGQLNCEEYGRLTWCTVD